MEVLNLLFNRIICLWGWANLQANMCSLYSYFRCRL